MTTTVRVQLLMGLATLALVTLAGSPAARAAGVVTTCDEAHLDTALVGGGLVTFDCGDDATITVTSMKTVSADTTIDGGGMITISGGNSVAVFFVKSGVEFTVQNLTIANGNDAAGNFSGAIDTGDTGGGTLTITNSTFSGNSGSAIGGKHETVNIINSTFSGNRAGVSGGAISNNSGTLTVINSTFSGNSASAGSGGGAISYVGTGTARVTNSTFSGNSASAGSGGGAISFVGTGMARVTNSTFSGNSAGSGGGIFNQSTLTVANSTFSGNSASGNGAGGGINNNSGTLTVTNSTFSSNSTGTIGGTGGGINNSGGTVTVANSIVANSTSGGNCGGTITDGGHNIDDGTTCGFSTANASLDSTDPQLDPVGLQNNGGATQTIAMLPSSPAIDAGDDSVCAAPPVNHFDQRGFVRPGAGHSHCSVGAFEFYSVGNPTPTPTPIPVPCVGDCDGTGSVTVNEIIALVNIALGNPEASACMHGVPSGAEVDIALIIQAVNNALNECPA